MRIINYYFSRSRRSFSDRINMINMILCNFAAESGIVLSLFHPATEKIIYPVNPVYPEQSRRINHAQYNI